MKLVYINHLLKHGWHSTLMKYLPLICISAKNNIELSVFVCFSALIVSATMKRVLLT